MNETNGYALITGASAGIGAAFARELASRKVDLVLTARRLDRLQTLAAELMARHAIKVEVIACDLADRDAPRQLVAQLEDRGIAIDMLINNAGYGVTGYFLSQPWQTQADFIQVLMTAPTELCHRLLPGMRERGHGRIINVASLAGHSPGSAGQTLYAGAKSYLVKLSQALTLEYAHDGVHTCAVCPGFTWSEFHDVTGTRRMMDKLPKWMWLQADQVARAGIEALERGQVIVVPGWRYRLLHGITRHLPDNTRLKLMARNSSKIRKAD